MGPFCDLLTEMSVSHFFYAVKLSRRTKHERCHETQDPCGHQRRG